MKNACESGLCDCDADTLPGVGAYIDDLAQALVPYKHEDLFKEAPEEQ